MGFIIDWWGGILVVLFIAVVLFDTPIKRFIDEWAKKNTTAFPIALAVVSFFVGNVQEGGAIIAQYVVAGVIERAEPEIASLAKDRAKKLCEGWRADLNEQISQKEKKLSEVTKTYNSCIGSKSQLQAKLLACEGGLNSCKKNNEALSLENIMLGLVDEAKGLGAEMFNTPEDGIYFRKRAINFLRLIDTTRKNYEKLAEPLNGETAKLAKRLEESPASVTADDLRQFVNRITANSHTLLRQAQRLQKWNENLSRDKTLRKNRDAPVS